MTEPAGLGVRGIFFLLLFCVSVGENTMLTVYHVTKDEGEREERKGKRKRERESTCCPSLQLLPRKVNYSSR